METKRNIVDEYHVKVFNVIVQMAPLVGLLAAGTFTLARFLGLFAGTSKAGLLSFDAVFVLYLVVAFLINRMGILDKNDEVSQKRLISLQILLVALTLLQWNLITYIFPSRDFWGFAPLFVLLNGFFFAPWAVVADSIGIGISIAVSWLIKGEQLLPEYNSGFTENVVLRVIALTVSFIVIYLLVYYASVFKKSTLDHIEELSNKSRELEEINREIIGLTADIVEQRDHTSGTHIVRVQEYTRLLTQTVMKQYPEYGITVEQVEIIALASTLHDIGKIKIPDSVLLKTERLTEEEFEIMKRHPVYGSAMTDLLPDKIGTEFKKYCREICMYHHERYDGNGYPIGLKGDDIPVWAQIVSIIDCFDALTTDRPYKKALDSETAISMIMRGECGVFSERMLKCLQDCAATEEFKAV